MNRFVVLAAVPLLAGCSHLAQAVQYRAAGDVGVAQAQANGAIGVAQWEAAAATAVANAEAMRAVTVASIWAGNVQLLLVMVFVLALLVIGYRLLTLYYRNRQVPPMAMPPARVLPPTPQQIEAMRTRARELGGELKQNQRGEWFVFVDKQPVKRLTVRAVE